MPEARRNGLCCSNSMSIKCFVTHICSCVPWIRASWPVPGPARSYLEPAGVISWNSDTESCNEQHCPQEMSDLLYYLKFKRFNIRPKKFPGSENCRGTTGLYRRLSPSLGDHLQGTSLPHPVPKGIMGKKWKAQGERHLNHILNTGL